MKSQLEESANEPPTPAGFIAQCYLLYKRQLLSLKRDYTLLVVRLLCHLLIWNNLRLSVHGKRLQSERCPC